MKLPFGALAVRQSEYVVYRHTFFARVQMSHLPVSVSWLFHSTVCKGISRVVWVQAKVEVI